MLKKRKPVAFGKGLKTTPVDWRKILKDNEQTFLTDNQLSVFFDKKNPGCEKIHFYPIPFPHQFTKGKWDYLELVSRNSLQSVGPKIDFLSEKTTIEFLPSLLQKTMITGKAKIVERSAVSGNTLVMEWSFQELNSTVLNFSLPYFDAGVEKVKNGICLSIKNQVFVVLTFGGRVSEVCFETKEKPLECKAQVKVLKNRKIYLVCSFGYNKSEVIRSSTRAVKIPGTIFKSAEKSWEDYFTKIVPHFSCSDKNLEKLYYYQVYTTRADLYDIPYEPFTHPYTCPWKTGAIWQWSWNTPINSIGERWLNDKQIGAGGILLEGDNGGGLNVGSYLHPVKKIRALRSHNEYMQLIGAYIKKLPEKYDLMALATIPHTTPNGLLGAWEFYLCSGDKKFLREALGIMREAEYEFSKHALLNGLHTTCFVDEFDYSLRLKPFIKAFKKGDPEMMMKMDTPFIAIDYNCYLYVLREKMIEAANILRADFDIEKTRRKNEKLKSAIQRYMWNEKEGFFFDVDPRDMKHSNVKCLQAFSTLFAGIASPEQAERMVKRLKNPKEFGTPYPCPSVSMDTPDVDPSLLTYGGDVENVSGLWFTVEGLVRYGYTGLAGEYINKAIEMVTKEGPSSSYSYHCLTGKYNMEKHALAYSCAMDLICKYIIGINPQPNGEFKINPVALPKSGVKKFKFGPYLYRGKWITVEFNQRKGIITKFNLHN